MLILAPDQAMACACCAEPGEYRISFAKPTDYEISVLERLEFGGMARLYTTVAGLEEDAKGLSDPSETYFLTGSLVGKVWKLSFRDGKKNGTLTLSLPAKMLSYRADLHTTPPDVEPTLYKEWRFEGRVDGTGIFRSATTGPTKYFLVFQGNGNNCYSEADFSHWRLEIRGKMAHFAFYGEFKSEALVTKHAKGTFEVKISPQAADENVGDPTVGRMSIDKQFVGDIDATSKGQMLSAMTDVQGSAGYVALERVNGTLDGRKGTFVLQHLGIMKRGVPELSIKVVPDSGTGELVGLEGTMTIDIVDSKHFYEFEYTIAKHE
jgi:hypothetical protein